MYYFWNMSRTGSWPVWWDACTDEKATRRGAGLRHRRTAIVQHLTAALSAAFVTAERDALKTCHSETRIKAERPRCEITGTPAPERRLARNTDSSSSHSTRSADRKCTNTSRQAAIVWQPAYNQANLSQVIAIHINKQENNNADVAKFINCKSSSREEKFHYSAQVQCWFDSVQ